MAPAAPRRIVVDSRVTLIQGLKMPKPPTDGAQACAYADSDGWLLHWIDDGDMVGEIIAWPFVEDQASSGDMERAGFVVVRR